VSREIVGVQADFPAAVNLAVSKSGHNDQEVHVMTFMQATMSKWEAVKPMVFALAIGLVVGPIISNMMGWQVTSGTAQARVQDSILDLKASFCDVRARADVAEPNKLDWNARNELAKKWSIMPGGKELDSSVSYACARKLAG
jgi:hypothetical protein